MKFSPDAERDFCDLRITTSYYKYDRTKYISILESVGSDVLLFLRPPGFGKTLTLSMLEYFHDVRRQHLYKVLFEVCGSYRILIFFTWQ